MTVDNVFTPREIRTLRHVSSQLMDVQEQLNTLSPDLDIIKRALDAVKEASLYVDMAVSLKNKDEGVGL